MPFSDEGRLAVAGPDGPYFLPGGGIEDQETVHGALRRELLEELDG